MSPAGESDAVDPLDGPLSELAREYAGRPRVEGEQPDGQLGLDADYDIALDDVDDLDDGLDDEPFDAAAVAQRNPRKGRRVKRYTEATLARTVVTDLNGRTGVRCRKVVGESAGGPGEPDLDITVRLPSGIGRTAKIELKVGTNRPTAVQTKRLLQWQKVGALVGWATSVEHVDEILAHVADPSYQWNGIDPGAPTPL